MATQEEVVVTLEEEVATQEEVVVTQEEEDFQVIANFLSFPNQP